jgi:hypothetical protein
VGHIDRIVKSALEVLLDGFDKGHPAGQRQVENIAVRPRMEAHAAVSRDLGPAGHHVCRRHIILYPKRAHPYAQHV